MPAGRERRKNKETLTGDFTSEQIPVWVRMWSRKRAFALHWEAPLARTCVTFGRMWVSDSPPCAVTNFLFFGENCVMPFPRLLRRSSLPVFGGEVFPPSVPSCAAGSSPGFSRRGVVCPFWIGGDFGRVAEFLTLVAASFAQKPGVSFFFVGTQRGAWELATRD